MQSFLEFLQSSYTAYHTVKNLKTMLLADGFESLDEKNPWQIRKGGKYFVERDGSALVAFKLDSDEIEFKIVASHVDSPALKIKQPTALEKCGVQTLNTEPYGGGIWYSFFDRPLKIAGRAFVRTENGFEEKTVVSDYQVTIPSLAIHQQRDVNEKFSVDEQIDLQPILALQGTPCVLSALCGGELLSHDLFLVNAETPYEFGVNGEFLASPRLDNLTSVFASISALLSKDTTGNCVAAFFDSEEVGSTTYSGAGSDLLKNTLRRICLSLGKTEEDYCRALASSFLVSADNAHAVHPNHPEKSDPTNLTTLGGGVVIKHHAKKAYATTAKTAALFQTVLEGAGIAYQAFFNRSGAKSGGTLGACSITQLGIPTIDIGIAQLAMHSACECIAKSDYSAFENGLTAFFAADFTK